ncbi:MAG: lamin tail domain-containing protein [Calditrichaeota bacterium]|nr:lamin tail domain-containing protein [Calditrichota bacterium]
MRRIFFFIMVFVFISNVFCQIYISEVSDAAAYKNEFLELYNNSNSSIDLTGYKLIRVDAIPDTAEYVYDIGTNESGTGSEFVIPAYGFMIIARGNDKATFESEWGTLSANTAYNNGNTLLYFGTATARRWRLRSNDGTPDTDDGTLLDDTGQAVGGSGNRHYQKTIGGSWILDSYTNATPGAFDTDQSLPVTLTSFQAVVQSDGVLLKWRTESEIDNLGFEIYRSQTQDADYQLIDSYRANPNLKGQLSSSTGA